MIISKKNFEREVDRRVNEIMQRNEFYTAIRDLRSDVYAEIAKLHDRINNLSGNVPQCSREFKA